MCVNSVPERNRARRININKGENVRSFKIARFISFLVAIAFTLYNGCKLFDINNQVLLILHGIVILLAFCFAGFVFGGIIDTFEEVNKLARTMNRHLRSITINNEPIKSEPPQER